jgi:predicted PurR-regulated permease PerM
MIDPNVLNSDHVPSRSTMLDLALQIGLVGFLIYACSRYISPFSDLLIWSAILAVMLYPLHLRLAVRLGNRWSALLIGLVGVAVMLVAMATVVASLASSLYSLIVGLHNHGLATLAGVMVLVALVSEVFVESVQQAAVAFGMPPHSWVSSS